MVRCRLLQDGHDLCADSSPGSDEEGSHRGECSAEASSYLSDAEGSALVEDERDSLTLGQRGHGCQHSVPECPPLGESLGVSVAGRDQQELAVAAMFLEQAIEGRRHQAPAQHPALVGGDAVQPRAHRRLASEPINVLGRFHERRLGDVLGVLGMAAQLPCEVSDIVRLRPDEIYLSRELSIVSHVHAVSLTQRQRGAPRPKDLTEAG
jgi:hypothetical protein